MKKQTKEEKYEKKVTIREFTKKNMTPSKQKKDICNICNKPFEKDSKGEWINHNHTLPTKKGEK